MVCHSERSEESNLISLAESHGILRYAQNDKGKAGHGPFADRRDVLVTCYLLPDTWLPSPATCHLPLATGYSPFGILNSSFTIWLSAARPRTLPAALAPVLVGSALAWREGAFKAPAALACLSFALLVQIGANFANDYYDFIKGADTAERVSESG